MPTDATAPPPDDGSAPGLTQVGDRRAPRVRGVGQSVQQRLRGARGFVFDMDGTLVLGDPVGGELAPLPGALEITRWLDDHGVPFAVCTNGTARTPRRYAAILSEAGFGIADAAVVTPATSAVTVLRQRRRRRVMVLGTEGLVRPLGEAGIETVPPGSDAAVDAVLVGWYREFDMDTLEAACRAVWNGAELYSCSESRFFATAGGRTLGTSRAITAAITSVTGCEVRVVGKPSVDALQPASRDLGAPAENLVVVGDDPDLEVPMAHRGGALAVAVGTGIGTSESYAHLPEPQRPHLNLRGVDELLSLYQRAVGDAES